MKRFIFILTLTLLSYNVVGSGHIKFMGVEVTGMCNDFRDSLETKGFVYISSYKTLYEYQGMFANEKVTLNVLVSPKTKTVCKVIVYFPSKNNWADLKTDYFIKKNMYKAKYTMDKDYEFFSSPYENGDGYELRALAQDKCHYASFLYAENGYIIVEIDKTAQVKVIYEDEKNMKIAEKELEQNAIDDI